jgi:hypothetical protein
LDIIRENETGLLTRLQMMIEGTNENVSKEMKRNEMAINRID